MKLYEFDAEIKKREGMDAAFVEFPYDVEKEFGTRGQVKVQATFDGVVYRGSLAKMGHHCHLIGLTKKLRKSIGKQPGDTVHVTIKKDEAPRTVEVPQDLASLLNENSEAKAFFDSLSYTNRKEYAEWITSAKKAETREKRLKKTVEMLLNKIKNP